jgi:uncharacterized membrane protein
MSNHDDGMKSKKAVNYLWWSWYYIADWISLVIILVIAEVLFGSIPGVLRPYQRYNVYLYMQDPAVAYPNLPGKYAQ